MNPTVASCGCEVHVYEHIIGVAYADIEGFKPCVVWSSECPDCAAEKWLSDDYQTFATMHEAETWLKRISAGDGA